MSAPTPHGSSSLLSQILIDVLLPSSSPLRSLSIRLADKQLNIPDLWVEDMLKALGGTLQTVSFGNCVVGNESIRKICRMCPELDRLELAIPAKDIVSLLEHLFFQYCTNMIFVHFLASLHTRFSTVKHFTHLNLHQRSTCHAQSKSRSLPG